jgi:DNA-binding response OmpR family regulator
MDLLENVNNRFSIGILRAPVGIKQGGGGKLSPFPLGAKNHRGPRRNGGFVVKYELEQNMRILVVEDESKVANFLKKGLEQSGYEVHLASDGEAGLEMSRATQYDLVLVDLMLPRMSGWQLIPLLREGNPVLPILALTAKDSIGDRVRGLNLGCDDYVVKPFSFAELLARVQAQLRRGTAFGTAEMRIADLVIDPLKRKVTRAGKVIELSNKEFALLEYLLRNKDQIVTRKMITENVWDASFDNITNVVDVYINYLRNKLDRGFETRLIHTVRGVGYTLRSQGS